MAGIASSTQLTTENLGDRLRQALRDVDASAFLVPSRILRRVIKQDRELTGLGFQIPHRKTYVIDPDVLLQHVDREELGVQLSSAVPNPSILIERPTDKQLDEVPEPELRTRIWRMFFHARIHVVLDSRLASGEISVADVRSRINDIGQVELDEIHSVLKSENFLFDEHTRTDVYVEFAALFLELRRFAPNWLPTYFPSLEDFERIEEIICNDIDPDEVFEATRLADAVLDLTVPSDFEEVEDDDDTAADVTPHERRYQRFLRKADKANTRRNDVGAALNRLQASNFAPTPELAAEAEAAARDSLKLLVSRLQKALEFDDVAAEEWRDALTGVLTHAKKGFWNPDKRLLFDLQNVCVDHERDIASVDLLGFVFSLGKKPIKRLLPNQREVLMSKHLSRAARRVVSARLSDTARGQLNHLLHDAAISADKQMRQRLRPLIVRVLAEVGLQPNNVPEQIALRKLIDELLDYVAQHGFLTMGNLRDAIARNNLKLTDLSGLPEFASGDKLLQADKQFSSLLDGVYQRGESYLRWLQRLSSLAFGTRLGRFLSQYVAIPYGGAFVVIEAIRELYHGVHRFIASNGTAEVAEPSEEAVEATTTAVNSASSVVELLTPYFETMAAVFILGSLLCGLIHLEDFRSFCKRMVEGIFTTLRRLVVDVPNYLVHLDAMRRFLRSQAFTIFRRYVFNPAVLTLLFCVALPAFEAYPRPTLMLGVTVFLGINLIINTRVGRDVEEVCVEWVVSTWHQLRVNVFIALFEITMETFKRFLETFERVLYAVDEWLRFKSGETALTFGIKAVLGVFWSIFSYIVRFCVTLLVEPQINPIKHFPVVTVSHKIILPMQPYLARLLEPPLGNAWAQTVATGIVFVVPGVFGFLVWELKSNWRLYQANRSRKLQPVLVGDHGETMIRLMKPGFHSGTLPKLFARLRRCERKIHLFRRRQNRTKYLRNLRHLEIALRQFIQRELIAQLTESRAWGPQEVTVGSIKIASNSIRIELRCEELANQHLTLSFQEQSGWLVATIPDQGWMPKMTVEQRQAFSVALAGVYQMSGVELVREQLESCFEPDPPPYDIMDQGLVVWPNEKYDKEITYQIRRRSLIRPYPRATAEALSMPALESKQLVFGQSMIAWQDWTDVWDADRNGERMSTPIDADIRVLPARPPVVSTPNEVASVASE
ncbi:MAG: hypothetical protein CMJ78_02540 [Planctomycetaceae bacterium]|nr:hypothetical protein [Planctomycetaceae bacterium]